jgi:hypothetical protein
MCHLTRAKKARNIYCLGLLKYRCVRVWFKNYESVDHVIWHWERFETKRRRFTDALIALIYSFKILSGTCVLWNRGGRWNARVDVNHIPNVGYLDPRSDLWRWPSHQPGLRPPYRPTWKQPLNWNVWYLFIQERSPVSST